MKKQTYNGSPPRREYTCPSCKVQFVAACERRGKSMGKSCPAGHWHSTYQLKAYERRQQAAQPHKSVAKGLGSLGIGERTHQLALALQWMLQGYDKAVATLPPGSMARGLVEAAFGQTVPLSRAVLGEPA